MGYHGKSNYEERDRLFERSFNDRGVNKNQVKKELEDLFKAKPKSAEAEISACHQGHAWIRDWDGKYKCVRCKTLKPLAQKLGSSATL